MSDMLLIDTLLFLGIAGAVRSTTIEQGLVGCLGPNAGAEGALVKSNMIHVCTTGSTVKSTTIAVGSTAGTTSSTIGFMVITAGCAGMTGRLKGRWGWWAEIILLVNGKFLRGIYHHGKKMENFPFDHICTCESLHSCFFILGDQNRRFHFL